MATDEKKNKKIMQGEGENGSKGEEIIAASKEGEKFTLLSLPSRHCESGVSSTFWRLCQLQHALMHRDKMRIVKEGESEREKKGGEMRNSSNQTCSSFSKK